LYRACRAGAQRGRGNPGLRVRVQPTSRQVPLPSGQAVTRFVFLPSSVVILKSNSRHLAP
jgi:hypothetical protein